MTETERLNIQYGSKSLCLGARLLERFFLQGLSSKADGSVFNADTCS